MFLTFLILMLTKSTYSQTQIPTLMPPPVSRCPTKTPLPGSACDVDQMCSYDPIECCGEIINTSFAECENKKWEVSMADLMCDNCGCPTKTPLPGSACDVDQMCSYDPIECCGE